VRASALLDLSSDAIVMRDSQDRVVYWSKGATELYGYSEQEAMGRVTHELFSTGLPKPQLPNLQRPPSLLSAPANALVLITGGPIRFQLFCAQSTPFNQW
jgi:PAS domain-containing protein